MKTTGNEKRTVKVSYPNGRVVYQEVSLSVGLRLQELARNVPGCTVQFLPGNEMYEVFAPGKNS